MKILGKEKLNKKLAAIPKVARAMMRKALETSAAEIADTARSLAPFQSGDLRNSIGYTFGEYKAENANVRGVASRVGGDPDLSVTIHAGDAKAWYAALVEFGTGPHNVAKGGGTVTGRLATAAGLRAAVRHPGAAAQPFFFPAWRLGKKRATRRISTAINKAAKQVAAGGR